MVKSREKVDKIFTEKVVNAMETKDAEMILNQLRQGEIEAYRVTKADFLSFRAVLTNQEDFLHFRGNAQHGGETIYTYEPGWTK